MRGTKNAYHEDLALIMELKERMYKEKPDDAFDLTTREPDPDVDGDNGYIHMVVNNEYVSVSRERGNLPVFMVSVWYGEDITESERVFNEIVSEFKRKFSKTIRYFEKKGLKFAFEKPVW